MPNFLYNLEKDDQIIPSDLDRIKALKKDLKNPQLLPTDLLQYRSLFKRYAEFKYFSVDHLRKMAYFMSLEPVTGVNILNNILKVFKMEISPTAPGVSFISKFLIVRELNMYFKRIRKEDSEISFDMLDTFTEE